MFHAELDAPTHTHTHATHPTSTDPSEYSTFLESRPQQWEISALQLVLRIARSYPDLRFHIVHLSASDAVPLLQSALLGDGDTSPLKNLTVETCFHYLCLQDTDIPPNATQFKCCPPIRDESNRLKLIDALLDGTIQYVVSDHSPCVPELKKGDFTSAWGGVSGLGLGLSLLWTELGVGVGGRGRGRVELGQIVEWMGGVQAKQVGLQGKKGVLQKGAVADFVVFDPHATFEVTAVCHPSPSPSPSILSKQTRADATHFHRRHYGSRTKYLHTSAKPSPALSKRRTSAASWSGTMAGRATRPLGSLSRRHVHICICICICMYRMETNMPRWRG